MKFIPLPLIFLLLSCQSNNQFEKIVNHALQNGLHEVTIDPSTLIVDETIELEGIDNLVIKAGATQDSAVTFTSSIHFDTDEITCLDSAARLYEIKHPDLITEGLPDRYRGYSGWPELYVWGLPFKLARYPNLGYLQADSIIQPGSQPRSGDTTHIKPIFFSQELVKFLNESDHPEVNPASKIENQKSKIFLDGYWRFKWYDETIRIEEITPDGRITLAEPHHYGLGQPAAGLFYAINHPVFLDQQWEYYHDPVKGTIRFIVPDFNQGLDQLFVDVALRTHTLIRMKNCKNVRFEGFNMRYHAGTAIELIDCDSVEIRQCDFSGISQTVIRIEGGSDCGVLGCELKELGGEGILLSGGEKATLEPANHYVIKTSIHDFAKHQKTYAPAVNLQGVGHRVITNVIRGGPHNAILFTGNDHLIERNHIQNVCMNTSDAGAIYCGRDWTMGGTVIRKNSIQGLGKATHHNNWAIYLDDLASGITVEENIIVDCPSGILVGGGRYNKVNGNRLRNCSKASIIYDARGLGWYQPYLNDPEHTLWTRLREVPVDQSPWKDRFPWLQEIADDDPAIPKNVEILNNEILFSPEPQIHPTVKEYGKVQIDN